MPQDAATRELPAMMLPGSAEVEMEKQSVKQSTKEPMQRAARRIMLLREANGFDTIQALLNALSLSPQTRLSRDSVERMENGTSISRRSLLRICTLLHVDVDEIDPKQIANWKYKEDNDLIQEAKRRLVGHPSSFDG